ncbi:MAG: hypothetical protein K6F30_05985 [Lachnospiraceae bacterium]|nr:hypothetical protein [Lachnospiraceae bacterium]
MGAADRTEDVLKRIHVLFSKAEPYNGSKKRVIVEKTEMMDLLKELNECMYDMMDEHELTVASREKAEREQQKHTDEMIFDARKQAEDVYAASVIYSDQALSEIQDYMKMAESQLEALHDSLLAQMKDKRREVKANQYELKSQLQDFIDTQKYTRLIEEENIRRAKEKEVASDLPPQANTYAEAKPEIKVNAEYFEKAGLELPESEKAKMATEEDAAAALSADLDAEYFDWKEGDSSKEEEKKDKGVFSIFSKKDS